MRADQEAVIDLMRQNAALLDALKKLVSDIDDLIDNSHGVIGLHLNGDAAPWGDLLPGGRFEEWLSGIDSARAAIAAATGEAKC